ncbi:helix-turn-helix transcriptional regulator [Staphylococcus cohnii]
MNEFGKKIKKLRGEKSIREAARGIGISHTYLDSLEKGYDPRTGKERKPTIDVISKISIYYNYEFSDLVDLANVFVSLNDLPEEQKKIQAQKMFSKFEEHQNLSNKNIKKTLQNIINNDISSNQSRFLANSLEFLNDSDEDDIRFVGILLLMLNKNKKCENENVYEDLSFEFNKFLKKYLNINRGD